VEGKEFNSLGILNDKQLEEIKSMPIVSYLGDDFAKLLTQVFGKNQTTSYSDILTTMTGAAGELFGFTGDLLSPEMIGKGLDMANTAKGMMDQAKQWVEKIIGYITQATQVLVDAWTNREDYLYNFLKQIEKHLQEYENLQRYSTQIEKGRIASADDILNNWNKRWASLQQ
jgi:hypothetical protein